MNTSSIRARRGRCHASLVLATLHMNMVHHIPGDTGEINWYTSVQVVSVEICTKMKIKICCSGLLTKRSVSDSIGGTGTIPIVPFHTLKYFICYKT